MADHWSITVTTYCFQRLTRSEPWAQNQESSLSTVKASKENKAKLYTPTYLPIWKQGLSEAPSVKMRHSRSHPFFRAKLRPRKRSPLSKGMEWEAIQAAGSWGSAHTRLPKSLLEMRMDPLHPGQELENPFPTCKNKPYSWVYIWARGCGRHRWLQVAEPALPHTGYMLCPPYTSYRSCQSVSHATQLAPYWAGGPIAQGQWLLRPPVLAPQDRYSIFTELGTHVLP